VRRWVFPPWETGSSKRSVLKFEVNNQRKYSLLPRALRPPFYFGDSKYANIFKFIGMKSLFVNHTAEHINLFFCREILSLNITFNEAVQCLRMVFRLFTKPFLVRRHPASAHFQEQRSVEAEFMASSGHDNTAHAALERRWMLQDAGYAAALLLATDISCFEMKAGNVF